MSVRLGPTLYNRFKPPWVISYNWSFQGDTPVVVLFVLCFGVDFVLFEPYVRFHSFSSGNLVVAYWLLTWLTICFLSNSQFSFSEKEFHSDFALSRSLPTFTFLSRRNRGIAYFFYLCSLLLKDFSFNFIKLLIIIF